MSDPAQWTTAADITAAVRRRWSDGSLLRAHVNAAPFPTIDVPLRGPRAGDLGEHFDAARTWVTAVRRGSFDGRSYTLTMGRIGGRLAGSTEVPVRAIVDSYDQAWQLLGVASDVEAFSRLVASASDISVAREWALRHPLAAIGASAEWPAMLAAYRWLDTNRGSGLYLRQVSAPGVDTKFIERHRAPLAAMLDVSASASAFVAELGLSSRPATVRLRFDPAVFGMPDSLTEGVMRADELGALAARVRQALIIENEITYLSVPVPAGTVVIWGRGYNIDDAASLSWLRDVEVNYWGDIDTHGFRILSRVRTRLPQTESILMDRETLLAHEDRWGAEGAPTSVPLPGLTTAEATLHSDLVTDRYGPKVRLEQERIDWQWAADRLHP